MALFSRRRAKVAAAAQARSDRRDEADAVRVHLEEFVRTRVGVEAYVEPATAMTPPTVVLVATDGEWTRRRVTDPNLLPGISGHLKIPVYDVQLTGYPKRMRDWTERARREGGRPAP